MCLQMSGIDCVLQQSGTFGTFGRSGVAGLGFLPCCSSNTLFFLLLLPWFAVLPLLPRVRVPGFYSAVCCCSSLLLRFFFRLCCPRWLWWFFCYSLLCISVPDTHSTNHNGPRTRPRLLRSSPRRCCARKQEVQLCAPGLAQKLVGGCLR